jgi:hypothetical protein
MIKIKIIPIVVILIITQIFHCVNPVKFNGIIISE